MITIKYPLSALAIAVVTLSSQANAQEIELQAINITAGEQARQALGASTITEKDLTQRPIINDISQIVRMQPGVNLTGNSSTGQRGNNRQIDIRGMGPENTLILIDGKPVTSRNSIRYGWNGERDTRGDSNWVPVEMIERIEVLRGPAAARYGNGAAGGVVNIVTKQPTDKLSGSVTAFLSKRQHKEEGDTHRINLSLAGPIADGLSFRVYGNYNKTKPDAWNINLPYMSDAIKKENPGSFAAGKEGFKNYDFNGLIRWDITDTQSLDFELGYSQQKNLYAGDTLSNGGSYEPFERDRNGNLTNTPNRAYFLPLYNTTTNTMKRNDFALTHTGDWGEFSTKTYLQYTETKNSRILEDLAGRYEGSFYLGEHGDKKIEWRTATMKNWNFSHESYIPFRLGNVNHTVTVGGNFEYSKLDDPASMNQKNGDGISKHAGGIVKPHVDEARGSSVSANIISVYVEDNIDFGQGTILTPALRFDRHNTVGSKVSPGVNLLHSFNDNWSIKAGVAQAYKAPNLYQINPNYILFSRGQGCWKSSGQTGNDPCFIWGNANLKAETSINSEIGVEFKNDTLLANLTFFNNDYKNKIESGKKYFKKQDVPDGYELKDKYGAKYLFDYQWENITNALVRGYEGSFNYKITDSLTWNNNLTYMIKSENKANKEPLSLIPKYTINTGLSWQVLPNWHVGTTVTFYGKQKPKKINFTGDLITDNTALRERREYSITSIYTSYQFSNNFGVTFGIDNLFDKRLYREGNSHGTTSAPAGAGANTYNESGRTFNLRLTGKF